MSATHTPLPCASLFVRAEEGPLEIGFDAVRAYHGHGALAMLALVFQGQRGALPLLEADGLPVPRHELRVVSGHPGPGVRDALEFVTRAVTRGCYEIDLSLPQARYSAGRDKSYSFQLIRGTRKVHAVLREGVLPDEFFALLGDTSVQGRQRHAQLRKEIAERVLLTPPQALFDFTVQTTDA